MKKYLLNFIILLLPLLVFAQDVPPVLNDFAKESQGITQTVQINDNLNVVQIDNNDDNFDLVAVNSDMQVVWRTTIPGYGVGIGKYKGKIAAVAATEHGLMKGNGNTYKAFMIDPANGSILTEKIICQDNNDYIEIPKILINDNYFKFSVRQTAVTRQLHVGIPVFFIFQMIAWSKEANETLKLKFIDLDEKLDKVDSVNAVINGTYINSTCNTKGDIFVSWLNGPAIEVYKYANGKSDPVMQLNADVAIKPRDDSHLEDMILFKASETRPDYLYYTLVYLNQDGDPEMMLGKMDFGTNTKQSVTSVFKKADFKQFEKNYVSINKDMKADLGSPKYLHVGDLLEADNKVIVLLKAFEPAGYAIRENSLLIAAFDDDLKPAFLQIFPDYFSNGFINFEGTHVIKNKLYFVNHDKKGGICGALDLDSGQWDKLQFISRKNIKGGMETKNILWFDTDFIIPYSEMKQGMWARPKYDIMLQQDQY